MPRPDLNLLATLDVLLAEGSVVRAARRLGLSTSAMSRALTRLRETTGDPLLVRAGRGLVPTPRALELRGRVGKIVQEAEAALQPSQDFDPSWLERTFTLRTRDGIVENFGPALLARVAAEAPGVRLRFVQKVGKDSAPLREGTVDLETGVVGGGMGPEVRALRLFRDRFIGVVRAGHDLSSGTVTVSRYSAGRHILVSGRGLEDGSSAADLIPEIDRHVAVTVGGFSAALALARASDLIASVPERHTGTLRTGMFSFALPISRPDFTVSLLWHPRMDADPGHRWLRECIHGTCAAG